MQYGATARAPERATGADDLRVLALSSRSHACRRRQARAEQWPRLRHARRMRAELEHAPQFSKQETYKHVNHDITINILHDVLRSPDPRLADSPAGRCATAKHGTVSLVVNYRRVTFTYLYAANYYLANLPNDWV